MCTAITYQGKDHYFGRNLDYEFSYEESITVTPRQFPIPYRFLEESKKHHAYIGMAYVKDGYPLYYDATNEHGLSIAGLLFPQNARYQKKQEGMINLTPYELIPWLMGEFSSVAQARQMLPGVNLVEESFSKELPLTPMHWLLADTKEAITLEPMEDGLKVYTNPVGVLANNPPFPMQMFGLNNYSFLSNENPKERFCDVIETKNYGYGMGGLGLPGDLSSPSRFVRGAFHKLYSVREQEEYASVCQVFHILGSVEQPKGSDRVKGGGYETTIYTSCCNMERGIYYYSGYENRQITGVDMHRENLDGDQIISYPFCYQNEIRMQN